MRAWITGNVGQLGGPRTSGDDFHETADAPNFYQRYYVPTVQQALERHAVVQ